VMILLQNCHSAPYVPDLDGTYVPHSATIQTDPTTAADIHHLAYVDGAWRIQGHAWEVLNPPDTRMARPPHPFF
jgi:hypothetical protein